MQDSSVRMSSFFNKRHYYYTFLSFSEPSVTITPLFCMCLQMILCNADMSHFSTYSTWLIKHLRISKSYINIPLSKKHVCLQQIYFRNLSILDKTICQKNYPTMLNYRCCFLFVQELDLALMSFVCSRTRFSSYDFSQLRFFQFHAV